jgi:hypothetical protein
MSLIAWTLLITASLAQQSREGAGFAGLAVPVAQGGVTAADT